MTLDHKTSHKGPIISIDVWFMIGQYLAKIHLFENLRVQKNKTKTNQILRKSPLKLSK